MYSIIIFCSSPCWILKKIQVWRYGKCQLNLFFYRSHAYKGQSKLWQQITKTSMGKALPHLKCFVCWEKGTSTLYLLVIPRPSFKKLLTIQGLQLHYQLVLTWLRLDCGKYQHYLTAKNCHLCSSPPSCLLKVL